MTLIGIIALSVFGGFVLGVVATMVFLVCSAQTVEEHNEEFYKDLEKGKVK